MKLPKLTNIDRCKKCNSKMEAQPNISEGEYDYLLLVCPVCGHQELIEDDAHCVAFEIRDTPGFPITSLEP